MNHLDALIDAAIAQREATGQPWGFDERNRLIREVMDQYRAAVTPEAFDLAAFRSQHFTQAMPVSEDMHIQRRIILRLLDKLGY